MSQDNDKRRLSAQDASFLYMERPEAPLHIGSIAVFEGAVPYERFVQNIKSKIHLIPRYQQRVVPAPFNISHPTWEWDPGFDLHRHVMRVKLDAHDMAVQVKAGVPFPGRMADIERRRHYPLLVTRDEVDLRCDVLDEALVRYSTLEDRYRADVQGRLRPLHVEERRVLRTQAPFVIVLGHRRFPSPGRAP